MVVEKIKEVGWIGAAILIYRNRLHLSSYHLFYFWININEL
jgi:hypothetical protein